MSAQVSVDCITDWKYGVLCIVWMGKADFPAGDFRRSMGARSPDEQAV